jgi:hypothetical protein
MINTQGNHLKAVWGSSKTDVFAVGCNGKIMHFNGNKWKEISDSPVYNTECSLNDVWGKSKSDVLTVGTDGIMMHFNGDEWTKLNSITTQDLNAIWWASDHNVFVAGNKGTVLYYDGSIWSEMPTPFNDTHYHLNAIWGKSENDIFSAGGSLISSKILHYNGKNWKEETIPFTGTYVNLQDIYGSKRIFSVGKHGIILELPPSLMLSFLSDQFHEGDSFFLYVDVILDEVKEDDTIVFLKSSDSSEIITPETVTISSGYTYTTFKFEIVDDSILDGSQKLAITASLINNYSATNEIIIHDNEKALLSINIPKFAVEGEILPNQGVVFADKTVGKNTSVALVSSDISELVIPETVTIPAGMSSATFDLIAVEDKLNDGMQIVSVNAFVEGWESTSSQITIKDNAQDFSLKFFTIR